MIPFLAFLVGCTNIDADGDGTSAHADCDDHDPEVYPGAVEVCDGVDNDCNGEVDEAGTETDGIRVYRDADADGYGDENDTKYVCDKEEGWVAQAGDCEDDEPEIHPFAAEYCDGIDNDCSGVVDDDAVDGYEGYVDADGDGFGGGEVVVTCDTSVDLVDDGSDCDDEAAAVHPDAEEVCDNGTDEDCSGELDDAVACTLFESCSDVQALGLDDGPYTIEPAALGGNALEVTCVEGYTTVDSAMLIAHAHWIEIEMVVSNEATWTVEEHSGWTSQGFWIRTVRNIALGWRGKSMCVRAALTLPWEVVAIRGAWSASGYLNRGADDDDFLDWGQASDEYGYGHTMFGVQFGPGIFETIKSSGTWGSDWSDDGASQTWEWDTELAVASDRVVWEVCDNGDGDEDYLFYDFEIEVYVPPVVAEDTGG